MTLEEAQKNYKLAASAGNTERAIYLAKQIREMRLNEEPNRFRDMVSQEEIDAALNEPEFLKAKLKKHEQKAKENRPDATDHAALAKLTRARLKAMGY